MPAFISRRISIRWIPEPAHEPTDTIVLTGERNYFLDTRFNKDGGGLDWAFAGLRVAEGPDRTRFIHLIDSRTEKPDEVVDEGMNTTLTDGTTLEKGSMINPDTGNMSDYEEIWEDIDVGHEHPSLFLRSVDGKTWHARVGNYQAAMGRRDNGSFWVWNAKRSATSENWSLCHSVGASRMEYLPEPETTTNWQPGNRIEWTDQNWEILENSSI